MSHYTTSLKTLIDNNVDIFNFDYPIFDETYRATFEEKFKNHFMFREIGVETVGRFIFNLKSKLNEIMPFYNKRYLAQALEQRILDNYDVTETMTREVISDGTSGSKRLFSDTPQSRIELASTNYVSEINDDTETRNDNNNENWTRTMKGNIGIQTDADSVVKYMNSLVNVDLEVFKELEILFMGVY